MKKGKLLMIRLKWKRGSKEEFANCYWFELEHFDIFNLHVLKTSFEWHNEEAHTVEVDIFTLYSFCTVCSKTASTKESMNIFFLCVGPRKESYNSLVSKYKCPRAVALASSACVDKTTKIITEFTCKDPFLHLKRAN